MCDSHLTSSDVRERTSTYGTPLCSALLLALLGLESLSWKLLIGAVVIVTAGLMSRTDS
jgi:drug/metabolite transporter (DMT)-like permease